MESRYSHIYFIGIGGIGMSALARYFNTQGKIVMGYDKTPSDLTQLLVGEGMEITFEDSINQSIQDLRVDSTLVVYTPAIPKENQILQYFDNHNFLVKKRAEVLGEIVNASKGLAVAGTHGKTTTSSLLAHIFNESEIKANAFLGGISTNLGSNVLTAKDAKFCVVEADEFDRSFHRLFPFGTVVTSADPDHLDIYETEAALIEAFEIYVSQVESGGPVVMEEHVAQKLNLQRNILTYGYGNVCDYTIGDREVEKGQYRFSITHQNRKVNLKLGLPGIHNVLNATAAFAIAHQIGVEVEIIKKAMASFKGVARRFDVHINTNSNVYIDDYAHHPDELRFLIQSIREMYPGRKITMIFQPHLYSRTRDFMEGFVKELSKVDQLVLVPIYPAREKPIEGVSVEKMRGQITIDNCSIVQKDRLLDWLKQNDTDVVITAGAGDIDREVASIKKWYEEKAH